MIGALREAQITVGRRVATFINTTKGVEGKITPPRIEHIGGSTANIVIIKSTEAAHQLAVAVGLKKIWVTAAVRGYAIDVDVGVITAAVLLPVDERVGAVKVSGDLKIKITQPLIEGKLHVLETLLKDGSIRRDCELL